MMRLLKFVRVMVLLGGFSICAFVGHAYYTGQHDAVFADPNAAKFVTEDGTSGRTGIASPTLFETAKVFVNGLLGREEEPKTDLAALQKRRAIENYFKDERHVLKPQAETEFWTNLMAKVGLGDAP